MEMQPIDYLLQQINLDQLRPLEESLSDIFATSVSIAPNALRGVPHHTAQTDLFLSYHRMVYPSIGGIPRWSSLATCGPVFIRNI
ncbi:hypothetical protein T4B_11877 [Trichinella pseudospiralis]|uniref:Uncharacterized protein n=1 Tax=Trichinella pseudospiralis TaxID=6337 RepID=A0A0V1HCS1_TRIPS|nr:hypothetical protein T4A_10923 [Trichinella pseudospiralis]KRZ08563.1 hypothetical protein T4B_11877 [Trichinella pseudospiralis]KRZ41436.1 hypothetical protein T4C_11555 [Trichinella pseudospiralis]